MSDLRILQLYHDCGPGGAEQMILDLCRWLQARGHQVTVATCREGWLADRLRENRIETFVVALRRRFDLETLSNVLGIVQNRSVDVVHTHELPAMMGLAPAALVNGLPVVATLHGREYIAAHRRRRLACWLAASGCRRVVAVSRAIARFLVEDVGIASSKVETIYNGIDTQPYSFVNGNGQLRDTLGISPEARVIGTVGSLYPVKGQTYLLQSMSRLVRQIPTLICLVVGRGQLLSALQGEAAALGLTEHVRFLGYRTDVPELLGLMEAFVLPSLSEGLPLGLLEAQAAGRPVVASDVGGNGEVVQDGTTGYLVPAGRPEPLADRIAALLSNPAQAKAMGERGRTRVHEMFSLEVMCRRYLSLYRSCANGVATNRPSSAC